MSANGQLAPSELAPIGGGFYLRKDAAAAFLAMQAEARRRFGREIEIRDAYRKLGQPGDYNRGIWDQWYAWEDYEYHGGNLAARPGTSNHGWGTAIDLKTEATDRAELDQIGAKYGFSKSWSDAQSEWWHILYKVGVWKQVLYKFLPLHTGLKGIRRVSSGPAVYGLSRRLQTCGYLKDRTSTYDFGVEKAVRAFQSVHHLSVDGVVGPFTWEAIKAAATACSKSGKHEVRRPVA